MPAIHPMGFIIGGICDHAHQARSQRERGAWRALSDLQDKKGICENNGWFRIIKLSWPSEGALYRMNGGANYEIGYRRFRTDIAEPLHEQGKAFRWGQIEVWINAITSFEWGLQVSHSGMRNFSYDFRAKFDYFSAKSPCLYEQRKKAGHFINSENHDLKQLPGGL